MSHGFAIMLVQVPIVVLIPLGFWWQLAIYGRRHPGILRPLLRKLTGLNTALFVLAAFLYVMGIKEKQFMKVSMLLLVFSSVLGMIRLWVQRRVYPV